MGGYSLLSVVRGLAVDFSSTANINYMWNYSSLTSISMSMQVATGLFVSMYIVIHAVMAFDSVEHIMEHTYGSHLLRFFHANICSFVFMVMFVHITKGMWYSSWVKGMLWKSSVVMLILTMGSSFLGYVLPWGHMSFWGATVITGLIGVAPYGADILVQVWGSFSLSTALLGRLFSLHFLLPLLVIALIMVHLMLLHQYVSSSVTLGVSESFTQFYVKDGVTILEIWILMCIVIGVVAIVFMDADNWFHCNPLVTPAHIKPEWYFLFAYCILRCIPDKLMGVLSLAGSLVMVLAMAVMCSGRVNALFFVTFALSTWLGGAHLTEWFILSSQAVSVSYFVSLMI